jgi:S-adenosylmethionine:tRNA-ribosyltransferase-isomerase (queuine synthetase)
MPSASRPFSPQVVTRLVAYGVMFAPLTLDTGWRVHAAGTCGTSSATCICCSRSRAGRVALLAR